jgi:succinate-acetate transporter protein
MLDDIIGLSFYAEKTSNCKCVGGYIGIICATSASDTATAH